MFRRASPFEAVDAGITAFPWKDSHPRDFVLIFAKNRAGNDSTVGARSFGGWNGDEDFG